MSTDTALVTRAQQGDQDAFAALVEQNQGKIYNLALRMTGNPQDAADITQEAFLSAWRALPAFQGGSSFSTWLYRMAHNAAIDHLRKEKRKQEHMPSTPLEQSEGESSIPLPDYRYSPEPSLERKELRQSIEAGLGTLSQEHRAVLVLREMEGLSYREIAQALELEEGTVKSRIARARIELRQYLQNNGNFSPSVSSKKQRKGNATPFSTTTKGGEQDA